MAGFSRMVRKLSILVVVAILAGFAAFWILTSSHQVSAAGLPAHVADVKNGEYLFHAGGCASCHVSPDTDKAAPTELAGGLKLDSPFGIFFVPNISPDPDYGIGKWTTVDFVNAMKFGTAPDGSNLYPAFPYPSYQHMTF